MKNVHLRIWAEKSSFGMLSQSVCVLFLLTLTIDVVIGRPVHPKPVIPHPGRTTTVAPEEDYVEPSDDTSDDDSGKMDPCKMNFPCFNLGKCVTDALGLDYTCECYEGFDEITPRRNNKSCTYPKQTCPESCSFNSECWFTMYTPGFCYDASALAGQIVFVRDPDTITGHPYFIYIFQMTMHMDILSPIHPTTAFGVDTGEGVRMQVEASSMYNLSRQQLLEDRDMSKNAMYFQSTLARTYIHFRRKLMRNNLAYHHLLFYTYHSKDVDLKINAYVLQSINHDTSRQVTRYNSTSHIHVYDDPEECTPTVEIIGCSPQAAGFFNSREQSFLWDYREGHNFRPYIEQKCGKENSTIRVVWITHDIPFNITTTSHEDFAVKGTGPKSRMDPFDTWKSTSANFVPPHFGRSVLELLVYETVDASTVKSKISFYNSVQCQINVYQRLPLTVVWGGLHRSHARGDDLNVDITNSFLPWMENPYYWPNKSELVHWMEWRICLEAPESIRIWNTTRLDTFMAVNKNSLVNDAFCRFMGLVNGEWDEDHYFPPYTALNYTWFDENANKWQHTYYRVPAYHWQGHNEEGEMIWYYAYYANMNYGLTGRGNPWGTFTAKNIERFIPHDITHVRFSVGIGYSRIYTEQYGGATTYLWMNEFCGIRVILVEGSGLPLLNIRCLRNCGMGGNWTDDTPDDWPSVNGDIYVLGMDETTDFLKNNNSIPKLRVMEAFGIGDDLMIDTTLKTVMLVECIERCTPHYKKTESYRWELYLCNTRLRSCRLKEIDINWKKNYSPQNSRVLILNEGTLKRNEMYHFRVYSNVKAHRKAYTEFLSEIQGGFKKYGSCFINPKSGMGGVTDFEISCKGFEKNYVVSNLNYKFLQVQEDENGNKEEVLLDWSFHSAVRHIRLAKGKDRSNKVKVIVLDTFGSNKTIFLNVALTAMTPEMMKNLTFNLSNPQSLRNRATASDVGGVVRLSSALVDALSQADFHDAKKRVYISFLLNALSKSDVPCIDTVKQLTGVMTKVSKLVKDHLDMIGGINVMRLYANIIRQLNQYSQYYWAKRHRVTDEIVVSLKVFVSFVTMAIKRQKFAQIEETLYFDVYDDLREVADISEVVLFSGYAYEAASTIGTAQLNRLVETEYVVVKDDDYYLHCWVNYSEFFPKSFGDAHVNLAVPKLEDYGLIGFTFLRIQTDIFWWRSFLQKMQTNSHLVFTYMERKDYKKSYGIPIKTTKLKFPITFKFSINKSDVLIREVKGKFPKYDTNTPYIKKVQIYRFAMKEGQYLSVNFTYLNITEPLKVVFKLNNVPKEDDFKKAITIGKKAKALQMRDDLDNERLSREAKYSQRSGPRRKRKTANKSHNTKISDKFVNDIFDGSDDNTIKEDYEGDAAEEIQVYEYINSDENDKIPDVDTEDEIDTPEDVLKAYDTSAFIDTNDNLPLTFDENSSIESDIYIDEFDSIDEVMDKKMKSLYEKSLNISGEDVNIDTATEDNLYVERNTDGEQQSDGEEDVGRKDTQRKIVHDDAKEESIEEYTSDEQDTDDYYFIEGRAETKKKGRGRSDAIYIVDYHKTPRVKRDSFIYMAVLPTLEKLEDESPFAFKPLISSCHEWVHNRWKTNGCSFKIKSTPESITCTCHRFGLTAAGSYTAPGSWYIPEGAAFVATGPEPPKQYYVDCLTVIIVVLILFVFLFMWAIFKDLSDIRKRKVIVPSDNCKTHRCGYLVTVYTGAHKDSGTSSSIGIQLFGTACNSERHLLRSDTSEVLQDGSTDWFMIYTARRLGDLLKIHVWSNCRGHKQAWYCSHIVVRDLQIRKSWVFMIERWVSLVKGDGLVGFRLRPTPKKDYMQKSSRFLRNIIHFGAEGHMWFSILTNHPRSFYSRAERVLVCACGTLLNTFMTIFLYRIFVPNSFAILFGIVKLSPRNLMLALACSTCSVPLTFVISFLFRKSPAFSLRLVKKNIPKTKVSQDENKFYYHDAEKAGRMTKLQKGLFYILPTDILCESHISFEKRVKRLKQPTETCVQHTFYKKRLHYHTNHFFLPALFRVLAWCLCVGGIVVFGGLCVYFGRKIKEVNTLEWFDTFLLMIALSILVIEPLKIIFTALVASYVIEVEAMDIDMERGYPLLPQRGTLCDKDLNLIRALQNYSPITTCYIPELRARERARLRYGTNILENICFILFTMVVFAAVYYYMQERSMMYYHTQNLREWFVHGVNNSKGVRNIKVVNDIYSYMNDTFIPLLDNASDPSAPNEMLRNENLMVGMPRLRQLRGPRETDCQGLPPQEYLDCIPPFSVDKNDKSQYFMGWANRTPDIYLYSLRAREQYWKFHNFSETQSIPIQGDKYIFTGGGYIADLGRYIKNINITLAYLKRNNWMDKFTAVIVFELCLYNVNNGFLTLVNIIFERHDSGFYFTNDIITSINLLKYPVSNSLIIEIAFALVVCGLVFYQVLSLQIYSFKKHFQDWWSIYDIFLSFVALATVSLYLIRRTKNLRIFYVIDQMEENQYLAIREGYIINEIFFKYMAFLIFLTTIRLSKIVMNVFCFKKIEITLYIEIMALIFLLLYSFTVLYGCSITGYLALGDKYDNFRKPTAGLSTVTAHLFGVNQEIIHIQRFQRDIWFSQMLFVIIALMSIIIYNTFRAVLLQAYTVSKIITKRAYNYGYCDYLREECRYHCKCRRKAYKMKTRSLRAGAIVDEHWNAADTDEEGRRDPNSRKEKGNRSPGTGAKFKCIRLSKNKRILFSNIYTSSKNNPSVLLKMKKENEKGGERRGENLSSVIETEMKKDEEKRKRTALMGKVGTVLILLKREIRETAHVLDIQRERRES